MHSTFREGSTLGIIRKQGLETQQMGSCNVSGLVFKWHRRQQPKGTATHTRNLPRGQDFDLTTKSRDYSVIFLYL